MLFRVAHIHPAYPDFRYLDLNTIGHFEAVRVAKQPDATVDYANETRVRGGEASVFSIFDFGLREMEKLCFDDISYLQFVEYISLIDTVRKLELISYFWSAWTNLT